jgi:hypothetical protein
MGLRFLSLAAAFAYRMPAKVRNADLRGEKIVELDLRRVQTRQKFANSSRIHEKEKQSGSYRAKLP